jgi:two-component system chemotaxis response regulator CheB
MGSIADTGIRNVIGVILTGMGADGAQGLKKLKENSAYIIAQDEESCVVFGMPKSTIKLGIVDKVLPIYDISDEITKAVEG